MTPPLVATATTLDSFLADCQAREIDWIRPPNVPAALTTVRVHTGNGVDALQVAVASFVSTQATPTPKMDDVRALWKIRWGRKAAPVLLVVAHQPDGRTGPWAATVCGTSDDPAAHPGLDLGQVERICAAALAEPNASAAKRTLARLLAGPKDQLIAGLTNQGLFASHELRHGVPSRADWAQARTAGAQLLGKQGPALINALGYTTTAHGSTAQVLSTGSTQHAVAILLDETEVFDRPSTRFGVTSPVAQGLAVAQDRGVPWLVVTRGTQIRLYPAKPDIGVGRKGQAETFLELDLALLTADDAAYLTLLFAPTALTESGTVTEILEASANHAAGLGDRLRDRVYVDVVPRLAIAIANQMKSGQIADMSEDDLAEAYHRTLTVLFRLLFISYAEDRGLLPYGRNPRYTNKALKTFARKNVATADDSYSHASTAIWEDLLAVWKAVDDGNTNWDVPAYNGGLFAADPDHHPSGHAIAQIRLNDAEIGPVLRALLLDVGPDGSRGPVDFRALTVRTFGTVYEGLLESSLSIAPTDLTVDTETRAYLPAADGSPVVVNAGEVYFHNASGARKATGSYFTKEFAVTHLLDHSLEPALTRHLDAVGRLLRSGDEAAAADKFFDFRVADLAMGSGHFLVAAIDRIERRFSKFLTEHPIPAVTEEFASLAKTAHEHLGENSADIEIEPAMVLRRQIARRCIYGLDLNLMAVELARLGIWIHTFVPGLPMSSLDHGLQVGNSLTGVGTVDEALNVFEPARSAGYMSLFGDQIEDALQTARTRLVRVARTAEATKREVHQAAREYAKAKEDAAEAKALLDAAVVVRLGEAALPSSPDEAVRVGRSAATAETIDFLRSAQLPYLFPEVFVRDDPGFDCLLGNPPWEKVQVDERGFWAMHFPGLRGMTPANQKTAMDGYRADRPDLVAELDAEIDRTDRLRAALLAGDYPGMGSGHPDLYKAFAWRFWNLLRVGGSSGLVMPRSAVTSTGTSEWRTAIFDTGRFADVTMLHNTRQWVFADVHPQDRFVLLALEKGSNPASASASGGGSGGSEMVLRGPFESEAEFRSVRANLHADAAALRTWGSGDALPWLPSAESGPVFVKVAAHPRFADKSGPFRFRAVQGDFNMVQNRDMFDLSGSGAWPSYKGGSINLWTPDTGSHHSTCDPAVVVPALTAKRLTASRHSRSAFKEQPRETILDPQTLPCLNPRIAFSDITNQSNTRTMVTALIPPNVILTHKAPYLLQIKGTKRDEAYLLGVLSSVPLDWYARRYVEKTLSFEILNTFPIPRPPEGSRWRDRVIEIAGRLAAIDGRFQDWADTVGVEVGTANEPDVAAELVAELDAVVALLYGLDRDDLTLIYSTFHRTWNYAPRLASALSHYDAWAAKGELA